MAAVGVIVAVDVVAGVNTEIAGKIMKLMSYQHVSAQTM